MKCFGDSSNSSVLYTLGGKILKIQTKKTLELSHSSLESL